MDSDEQLEDESGSKHDTDFPLKKKTCSDGNFFIYIFFFNIYVILYYLTFLKFVKLLNFYLNLLFSMCFSPLVFVYLCKILTFWLARCQCYVYIYNRVVLIWLILTFIFILLCLTLKRCFITTIKLKVEKV